MEPRAHVLVRDEWKQTFHGKSHESELREGKLGKTETQLGIS